MNRCLKMSDFAVTVETAGDDPAAPFVFVCEHASNAFPDRFGNLGLSAAQRQAHIAWDPGAVGLARGLLERLGGVLVAGNVSRLVYDCNRAPDAPGAMAAKSETHEIAGNKRLDAAARVARTQAVYQPFHAALHGEIAACLARGLAPVVVTLHSFTPTWFGAPRAVEFGVIHDADPRLAQAVLAAARARTALKSALNAPYSAADGVTHTLRLQALPYGLSNVMLELRNDLVATPEAEENMAEMLVPVLAEAVAALAPQAAMRRAEQAS